MDIETWLYISLFVNFCYGIESLYRERNKIKIFCLELKNKIN